MENQASSKSIIINNGIMLGILGIVVHLAIWASGNIFELQWVNSVISLIAMIVFTVLGIKKFKELNGGFMSWGQGVKIGMGIIMISAIITVLYILLFTNVIEPDFQQQALAFQEKAWVDAGMTEEQIESAKEMTEKFQSPAITSAIMLAFSAFLGFIVSAIVSAIMKKNEEEAY